MAGRGGRAGTTTTQAIPIAGEVFHADPSGALYWPAERTLVVADLHLEKGSAHAARGWLVPPYDTRDTLARLAAAIDTYRPDCVIALGDSLHDRGAAERIAGDDLATLAALAAGRTWIWITGNHDPDIAPSLGGRVHHELHRRGIQLRHEPSPEPASGEIAGHLHPSARLVAQGVGVRRPCFVGDGRRALIPAFGAFTGGLNVRDPAVMSLFEVSSLAVHMLGRDAVYRVPLDQLAGD